MFFLICLCFGNDTIYDVLAILNTGPISALVAMDILDRVFVGHRVEKQVPIKINPFMVHFDSGPGETRTLKEWSLKQGTHQLLVSKIYKDYPAIGEIKFNKYDILNLIFFTQERYSPTPLQYYICQPYKGKEAAVFPAKNRMRAAELGCFVSVYEKSKMSYNQFNDMKNKYPNKKELFEKKYLVTTKHGLTEVLELKATSKPITWRTKDTSISFFVPTGKGRFMYDPYQPADRMKDNWPLYLQAGTSFISTGINTPSFDKSKDNRVSIVKGEVPYKFKPFKK